jgi:lipoprotein-anchoring transpeptidase ErfK/SrfK
MHRTRRLFLIALGLSMTAVPALAAGQDLATLAAAPETMRPGQYVWNASLANSDQPLSVTIDLTSQRAWVYRGEELIGISTISSGASGHETPTGSFTILQKNLRHKSNLYDSAPMPFMQRLSWDGLALHAGALPGHPASHGCVRLPKAFAKLLYGATKVGTTVTITDGSPVLETEPVETVAATAPADDTAIQVVSLPYAISQQ